MRKKYFFISVNIIYMCNFCKSVLWGVDVRNLRTKLRKIMRFQKLTHIIKEKIDYVSYNKKSEYIYEIFVNNLHLIQETA